MLVRTFVAAVALVLGAGGKAYAEQDAPKGKQGEQSGAASDSVPGHGHAAGALGNSSDTSGAEGGGGAGTNSGTAGRKSETAAGEGADSTSGQRSGRWDEGGGRTAGAQSSPDGRSDMGGQGRDRKVTGKVSQLSHESVTIQSAEGKRHTLKIVPQTKFTIGGKDAQRGQLAEGQQVRASYAEHGGDRIAVSIETSGHAPKGAAQGSAKGGANQKQEPKQKPERQ